MLGQESPITQKLIPFNECAHEQTPEEDELQSDFCVYQSFPLKLTFEENRKSLLFNDMS